MSLLSKNIETLMEQQNLRQEDLAKLADISQNAISKIISGKTKEPRKLPRIAKALGVSVEELSAEKICDLSTPFATNRRSLVEIYQMLPLLTVDEVETIKSLIKHLIDRKELVDR